MTAGNVISGDAAVGQGSGKDADERDGQMPGGGGIEAEDGVAGECSREKWRRGDERQIGTAARDAQLDVSPLAIGKEDSEADCGLSPFQPPGEGSPEGKAELRQAETGQQHGSIRKGGTDGVIIKIKVVLQLGEVAVNHKEQEHLQRERLLQPAGQRRRANGEEG